MDPPNLVKGPPSQKLRHQLNPPTQSSNSKVTPPEKFLRPFSSPGWRKDGVCPVLLAAPKNGWKAADRPQTASTVSTLGNECCSCPVHLVAPSWWAQCGSWEPAISAPAIGLAHPGPSVRFHPLLRDYWESPNNLRGENMLGLFQGGGGGCQTCQVVLSGPVELISNSFVTLIFYTDLQFLCKGKWTTLGVLLQRPLVSECVILSIPRIEEFEAKSSVHVGFLLIWAKMVSNSSSRKDLILKKWEQRFCDDWQPSLTDILPMGQN